jgi:hypothetical protein
MTTFEVYGLVAPVVITAVIWLFVLFLHYLDRPRSDPSKRPTE